MKLSQPWPKTEKRSFKLINDRLSLQADIKAALGNKINKNQDLVLNTESPR